ncbi:MAG: hypothetical protein LBB45_01030 [Methanobrevibacter sp.]|jgi:hypothetical protein|nr:hypothetical protein [Candidatus Methanovirga basalitermitum]
MLFTGCILVAAKHSNGCFEDYVGIEGFKSCVINKITNLFSQPEIKSHKINTLVKTFSNINIGTNPGDPTIVKLCEYIRKI